MVRGRVSDETVEEEKLMSSPEAVTPVTPIRTPSIPVNKVANTVSVTREEVSREDQELLAEERIARIKKISLKLKTPSGIADLEGEPAYKRRNIQLSDVERSDEDSASRMSLGENNEGKTGLSSGNSFLHDNVD